MQKTHKRVLGLWATTLLAVILLVWLDRLFNRIGFDLTLLNVLKFFAVLLFVPLTIYLIGVTISFLLRKLFWRVGRRLTLSYLLIGLLPFLLFAILLLVIGYMAAGILSQASFRADRQAMLNRLDEQNLHYVLTEDLPSGTLQTFEIYDSSRGTTKELPPWLKRGAFLGMVKRGDAALFVSARTYEIQGKERTVALIQPADARWEESVRERNDILVFGAMGETSGPGEISLDRVGKGDESEAKGNNEDVGLDDFLGRAFSRRGVLWWDTTPPLLEWESGDSTEKRLIMVISYPWRNLLTFYFGSPDYLNVLLGVVAGISGLLLILYMVATLLAGGLIYSITRAVNRIEKGTRAVERGDFSYRIGMKRRNQLGDVAQSFDRMTESISSLLTGVAEQERLQSEIDIAASIQRNLLPKEGPSFRGISFAAHFEPTAAIGGDYYDVFNLDSHRLAVAIGDVSGHGLSTGLVMAMVKAAMSTLVEEKIDEAALFRRLNDLVYRSTERRAFMTLGFTVFDLKKMTIRHTNAGHLYPYLLRKDRAPEAIEVPSLPLGIRPGIEARTVEVSLEERDTIVYLSDGIVEAQDEAGEPYGFEQLERMLTWLADESPADVQQAILNAVADHTGGRPAVDDATVMVLRFEQLSSFAWESELPVEKVVPVDRLQ